MRIGRPPKPKSERLGAPIFARLSPPVEGAFKRYCADVRRATPSAVVRELVENALRVAGRHPESSQTKRSR